MKGLACSLYRQKTQSRVHLSTGGSRHAPTTLTRRQFVGVSISPSMTIVVYGHRKIDTGGGGLFSFRHKKSGEQAITPVPHYNYLSDKDSLSSFY